MDKIREITEFFHDSQTKEQVLESSLSQRSFEELLNSLSQRSFCVKNYRMLLYTLGILNSRP